MADAPETQETMGDYSQPKSMMGTRIGPGPMGPMGPMGPGRAMGPRGVMFYDQSKLQGRGDNPLYHTFVKNPFEGMVFKNDSKSFEDTYAETYELVKKKHKWLSKPALEVLAKLTAIPRHLFRSSIANTTYNPANVAEMEQKYKNKL